MFATEFPPVTIPDWIERVALPKYPIVPVAAYILLGIGALLLMIGYFAPIKKIPALLAALAFMAYYPLSYLSLWFLFRFDEQERAEREPSKFEDFLFHHTHALAWSILGICALSGLVFFLWTAGATLRKHRRSRQKQIAMQEKQLAVQPVARPQTASLPSAAPPRRAARKPPAPPASDNPFNLA